MNAPRTLFLVFVLVAAFQTVYYYDQVPPRLASHFDAQGAPNGFMSRPAFFGLNLGIVALMSVIFLLLPAMLPRMPSSIINMPRKDYWLAPERKETSLQHMSRQLTWFGSATLVFLIGVMELAIRANLPGGSGSLDPQIIWGATIAFVVFMVAWIAQLMLHYLRVPKAK